MDRKSKNHSLNAILIRKRPYSESSLLLRWFSDHLGPVDTISKGILRAKAEQAPAPELFGSFSIEIVLSKRSDLHTLVEHQETTTTQLLRRDYHRQVVGAYLIELLERLSESGSPNDLNEHYFALLKSALGYLDQNQTVPAQFIERYEKKLAQLSGVLSEEISPLFSLLDLMSGRPKKRELALSSLKSLSK